MTPGTFLHFKPADDFEFSEEGDLQPLVDAIRPNCEVCQKGLLFLSAVKLYDDAPAAILKNNREYRDEGGVVSAWVDHDDIEDVLRPIFGTRVADRMEHLFERRYCFACLSDDPKACAVQILENLIANDGDLTL